AEPDGGYRPFRDDVEPLSAEERADWDRRLEGALRQDDISKTRAVLEELERRGFEPASRYSSGDDLDAALSKLPTPPVSERESAERLRDLRLSDATQAGMPRSERESWADRIDRARDEDRPHDALRAAEKFAERIDQLRGEQQLREWQERLDARIRQDAHEVG